MEQATINQRIKFLIGKLAVSARAFSDAIDDSPTNTQNYIGPRQTAPKHEYLAKVVRHFSNINAQWLLTGEGEPFLSGAEPSPTIHQTQKKTKGSTVIGTNHGDVITNIEECRKELTSTTAKLSLAEQEVKLLREQLSDKNALIAAKEETISLLRATFNRPN